MGSHKFHWVTKILPQWWIPLTTYQSIASFMSSGFTQNISGNLISKKNSTQRGYTEFRGGTTVCSTRYYSCNIFELRVQTQIKTNLVWEECNWGWGRMRASIRTTGKRTERERERVTEGCSSNNKNIPQNHWQKRRNVGNAWQRI